MPKRIIFSDEEINHIKKRFEETGSVTTVSEEIGYSFDVVKNLLNKIGIATASQKIDPNKEEGIKYDYIHSDLDIKEMAIKYQVKHDTIRKRAKKFGWKRLIWKRKYCKQVWERYLGKEEAALKMANLSAYLSQIYSGSGNPMFGKPTPKGSGNGWKGWYKGHYFRSLREAMFMIECDKKNIQWSSGEKISIPYMFDGKNRTYRPDFIVDNKMIEIKPERLQKSLIVQTKMQAGRVYCEQNNMEYSLIDIEINTDIILEALANNKIRFTAGYRTKFLNYVLADM